MQREQVCLLLIIIPKQNVCTITFNVGLHVLPLDFCYFQRENGKGEELKLSDMKDNGGRRPTLLTGNLESVVYLTGS